jgi:nicotinate phosphoribosyltransferase
MPATGTPPALDSSTTIPSRDAAQLRAVMRPPPDDPEARSRALHERLAAFPAAVFQFDARMREGWYTDRYFLRTTETLKHAGRSPRVRMQLFAKKDGVLAGVYEALRMLETTLLGVLARRPLVATNVRRVMEAANGKQVIFMAARHDDWRVQTPDGYAAMVGGAGSVSSAAGGAWWGLAGVGTMPHAVIAAFDGDVVAATLAFAAYVRDCEPEVQVVSLVDYRNDVVADSLAVARAMRERFGAGSLAAVRIDTSEMLEDVSLASVPNSAFLPDEPRTGVSSALVRRLRDALDAAGFPEVGIFVSGGFVPTKMRRFEESGVPVAGYGVGSSTLGHNRGDVDGLVTGFDFTADVVRVDGRAESKVGRSEHANPRFVRLDASRVPAPGARDATSASEV